MPKEWITRTFLEKKDLNEPEYRKNTDWGVIHASNVSNEVLVLLMDIGSAYGLQSAAYQDACTYYLSTVFYLIHCELEYKAGNSSAKGMPEHIRQVYVQAIYTAKYILDALDNMNLYMTIPIFQEAKHIRAHIEIIDRAMSKKRGFFRRLFR